MTALDTSNWLQFKLTDVFTMKNTKSITAASLIPDSGSFPYVTAQEGNNGVQMYVDCSDEWLDDGGCIMIGGKTLAFSYQARDFCSNDSHNIALYSKDPLSKSANCQLFLIAALRASLAAHFSWGDSISMKRAKEQFVTLPVTPSEEPDWDFMERKMQDFMVQQEGKLSALVAMVECDAAEVETTSWAGFRIDAYFEVVKGSRLTRTSMRPGAIRHIGASQFDNGITAMIANDDHLHPGNVLTVCYDGPVGTTFYQPEPFWATDAVNILYPNFDLDESLALFLIPVLQAAGSAYNYGEKWGAAAMRSTVIHLPVDPAGEPDWEYMRWTMRGVIAEREVALTGLQTLFCETAL